MKYGVIDIGSNSVRLMVSDEVKTLFKKVVVTRLAENMGDDHVLQQVAMERTVKVIKSFINLSDEEQIKQLFIFATAAVREAKNSKEFVQLMNKMTGYKPDIISGEEEAFLGVNGALQGGDGGVIDIGGGSTEVTIVKNHQIIYSKSVDIGVVKIKDIAGHDRVKAYQYIHKKLDEFGTIPIAHFVGIGGTATALSAMLMGLEPYDPDKINGYVLFRDYLVKICDKLYKTSVENIATAKGLQPERAPVISGGALLLLALFDKIGVKQISISDSDNLEGYLMKKREEYEKKN